MIGDWVDLHGSNVCPFPVVARLVFYGDTRRHMVLYIPTLQKAPRNDIFDIIPRISNT